MPAHLSAPSRQVKTPAPEAVSSGFWAAFEPQKPSTRPDQLRSDRGMRAFDLLASGGLLLLMAPLFLLAGIACDRGRQAVQGRDGIVFSRLSLQTRPGPLGRYLAALGVRYWPLLLHICVGHMAFVGPRVRAVAEPVNPRTLSVRPGLVNPWFIQRRTRVHFDSEASADLQYLVRRGLIHDLGLLFRGLCVACLPVPTGEFPIRVRVGDVGFDNLDMAQALERIGQMLEHKAAHQVIFVNPSCVNIAARHRGYRRALRRASLVLPDGIGIKIGSDLLGTPLQQNLNGTDLFPRLCEMLELRGARVFLLGGSPGVAEAVAARIGLYWPALRVVGTRDGYFKVVDEGAVVAQVRSSGADLLLVARGVPAQDLFIDRYLPLFGVRVAMGVGGLFDFVSGRVNRAPDWMRQTGLEWVFRLAQEPGRLWKRYLVGNFTYLARISLQRFGLRQVMTDPLAAPTFSDRWLVSPRRALASPSGPTLGGRLLAALAVMVIGLPLIAWQRIRRSVDDTAKAWDVRAIVIGTDPATAKLRRIALRCPPHDPRQTRVTGVLWVANLFELLCGRRTWFGTRPRTREQWQRLPKEWQVILEAQPIGVLHAPAWAIDRATLEEAGAAADVFWVVGAPLARLKASLSMLGAARRLN